MKILGIDLGDGETSVTLFDEDSTIEPHVIPIQGRVSILSAVGDRDGQIVIGDDASVMAGATDVHVRFKAKYLSDPMASSTVRRFAQGLLAYLLAEEPGLMASVTRTVVGCPAGWGEGRRQQYAALMESAGLPNVFVVPEPRAAFLYARHARGMRIDPKMMRTSALVVDIGSSTTDFAYIVDGKQQNLELFGDTNLGGGLIDDLILRRALKESPDAEAIKGVFEKSPAWESYCRLKARRIKETYFQSEEKWKDTPLTGQTVICYDDTLVLQMSLDGQRVQEMIHEPVEELGGRSFVTCLEEALTAAKETSKKAPPKVVIVTGGASRMKFFTDAVKRAFADSNVVLCPEPECSIARGLAYAGNVDEKLVVFRKEIAAIAHGETLSRLVGERLHTLYAPIAAAVYDVVLNCSLDALSVWRSGGVATIEEMEQLTTSTIEHALKGDVLREHLAEPMEKWLGDLLDALDEELRTLCVRCGIPAERMDLRGAKVNAGVDGVNLSVGSAMGLDILTGLLGVVLATVGAVLCGGSGMALIMSGPIGVAIGAVLGILVVILGKKGMEEMVKHMNIPVPVRKLVTSSAMRSGMARQRKRIEGDVIAALSDVRGGFAGRLCSGIAKTLGIQLEALARSAEMSIEA